MKLWLDLILLSAGFFLVESEANVLDIRLNMSNSTGSIQGKIVTSPKGKQGVAFLSIPVIQPPIGSLRFKSAVPIEPWKGIVDCMTYRIDCPQSPSVAKYKLAEREDEDCIQLSVYTSSHCLDQGNCSVIAFIHGGAHLFINPSRIGPENVINNFANDERNIVFVSLAYRKGVFGFLNLSPHLETSADTNIGLGDDLFGLKWVQNEIHNFGGSNKKVTLMGHSSGATDVLYLIFSPLSGGLFQQALIMSPPIEGEINPAINSLFSQKFAKRIGCAAEEDNFMILSNVEKILTCLRAKPWQELFNVSEIFENDVESIHGPWVDGYQGILSKNVQGLLERKLPKLNYFIGTTNAETKSSKALIAQNGNVNITRLNLICSHLAYERNYENKEGFRKACLKYYGETENACDLTDDLSYHYPTTIFANKFAENGKVFMYSFEYPAKGERFKWSNDVVSPKHAEDLVYLLYGDYDKFDEREFKLEEVYSEIISNFVKTGQPSYKGYQTKTWTKAEKKYLCIDFNEEFELTGVKDGFHKKAVDFYEEIVPKFAGKQLELNDFPAGHESFNYYNSILALLYPWMPKTGLFLKSNETTAVDRKLWIDHLAHLQSINKSSGGSKIILWIFIIITALLILFLIYKIYIRWRERKDYIPIDQNEMQ